MGDRGNRLLAARLGERALYPFPIGGPLRLGAGQSVQDAQYRQRQQIIERVAYSATKWGLRG